MISVADGIGIVTHTLTHISLFPLLVLSYSLIHLDFAQRTKLSYLLSLYDLYDLFTYMLRERTLARADESKRHCQYIDFVIFRHSLRLIIFTISGREEYQNRAKWYS